MFTARFLNSSIDMRIHTPIQISMGDPKFRLPYRIKAKIIELAPSRCFQDESNYELFYRYYQAQLNEIGIKRVMRMLKSQSEPGKSIVLLCFEDIRKLGVWCHRRIFADWWEDKTGRCVHELEDNNVVRYSPKERRSLNNIYYKDSLF